MSKTCPFCGEPKAEEWEQRDGVAIYKCHTPLDTGGEPERYRTHQCYMNQVRQLQTGETDYAQGFRDGVDAMRSVMRNAVNNTHDYSLTHPPMRRPEARDI